MVQRRRTEFQNLVMDLRTDVELRTFALYVSIGLIARVATLQQFREDRALPAQERNWMRPKVTLAESSLLGNRELRLKDWQSQNPTQLAWYPV